MLNYQGMCGGSFFAEWPYCLECLFAHGLRSQRDVFFYRDVIATASNALCGVPTPTAEFKSIFESAQAIVPVPTTGDTISSDQAVGQTAVSLYYTATVSQGPGRITGEATAATATVTGLLLAPSSQPGNTDADDTGHSTIPSTLTPLVSPSTAGSTHAASTPSLNTNATVKNKTLRKGSVMAAVIAIAAALVI
ncbi:hypothetical protein QBC37DRAFT_410367 [Rhypophila decipiens]|uniref:Uncharacterized protein n=1 Tax=Rhypophila decipiens TaxID=261697 RepID=A0AAN7BDA9_9PEZI|nr:hypothetical protein QBC37DRAFT_410367 [Rhypophila decipiens]